MQEDASKLESRTEVFDEVLSYAFSSQTEKVRKGPLIDTGTDEVFIPRSKFAELVGLDKSKTTDLLVIKKVVQTMSCSFIFSREMINTLWKNCHDKKYMAVTEGLMMFGNRELFVINTKDSGLISMNALPPAFKCLKEWDNEKSYLTDNCLTAQDKYKGYLDYFRIAY